MYQDIHYQQEGGIAVITINRPKVLNAIRRQTYYYIIDALHKSNADDAVNVIVMTGAEGRFSAGNDLSDLLPGADLEALNQCVIDIFDALAGLDKPLILAQEDRKSTRLNSSHVKISYAVFCLKKKNHAS